MLPLEHFFQCNRLLYYLKECFLPNTWAGQQYQYLNHGGDNPVANKKTRLGQVVTNFTGQVVTSCVCVCVRARARVCVCYNTNIVYTIHHRIKIFLNHVLAFCIEIQYNLRNSASLNSSPPPLFADSCSSITTSQ